MADSPSAERPNMQSEDGESVHQPANSKRSSHGKGSETGWLQESLNRLFAWQFL